MIYQSLRFFQFIDIISSYVIYFGREIHGTIPSLKFRFMFVAQAPRKERKIVQRDEKGRILRSVPPTVSV
jgi:hypothetical protein